MGDQTWSITRKHLVWRFSLYRRHKLIPGVLYGHGHQNKQNAVIRITEHLIDRGQGEVLNVGSVVLDSTPVEK